MGFCTGCKPSCASRYGSAATGRWLAASRPRGSQKHQRPAALGNQAISTIAHAEGPDLSGPLFFPPALAVPASSKAATAMETSQAASVPETATPVMGSTEAAIHTYGTYTAETHAMMDDAPTSADAHVSEAVITVATKYGGVAIIAEVIRACSSTAISRIVDGTGRASSECHVVSWEGILRGG